MCAVLIEEDMGVAGGAQRHAATVPCQAPGRFSRGALPLGPPQRAFSIGSLLLFSGLSARACGQRSVHFSWLRQAHVACARLSCGIGSHLLGGLSGPLPRLGLGSILAFDGSFPVCFSHAATGYEIKGL